MFTIGGFLLSLSCILAVVALILSFWGSKFESVKFILSARNAVYAYSFLTLLSLLVLAYQFVTHDYSNLYVWQHSSNEMPSIYLVSAIWGGMDGSMLLWLAIMCGFTVLVARGMKNLPFRIFSWSLFYLTIANIFFLSVVTFLTNPFRVIPASINHLNGNGLNPLLQNPSMIIHPPMLYLGFTGFVVPFSFCLAALSSGLLDTSWIRLTRLWTLISWTFLTAGIILGGNWAYIELGWGGFWAWDPVENASFLPWLTGTAFLHSVMVQEHRGMLKVWNIFLAVITYLLTVFGTFLTRSGVVQSVHAFAEADIGWVFLVYLGTMSFVSIGLVLYRRSELRPEARLESYLSRESAFLFNNLCLLSIAFSTIWGVLLPVISEAFSGEKSVVGPPFFNKINVPLFLILLFLMAVGPLIAWRRNTLKQLKKPFLVPFLFGLSCSVLGWYLDGSRPLASLSFGLSFFVLISVLNEWHKRARARSKVSGTSTMREGVALLTSKTRIYGAHIVHMGVALVAIAITASSAYKVERDIVLKKGESAEIGSYSFKLSEINEFTLKDYGGIRAIVDVSTIAGDDIASLKPEKRVYGKKQEVTTEVDIYSTLKEDLYIALSGLEGGMKDNPSVVFKVFINPLQVWLWISALFMLLGSLLLILESFGVFKKIQVIKGSV
jgi:cytochrome c-type biogenesis protein CcmF